MSFFIVVIGAVVVVVVAVVVVVGFVFVLVVVVVFDDDGVVVVGRCGAVVYLCAPPHQNHKDCKHTVVSCMPHMRCGNECDDTAKQAACKAA